MLVGPRWDQFQVESDYCHSIYIRRKLLLLAGSRRNIFHVEQDCSMPINNLVEVVICMIGSDVVFMMFF